eukprot:364447-Chlamydomonas_euryale.AAC.16
MEYLDAGASHVIVTSFVFRDGRLVEDRLKALVSDRPHTQSTRLSHGRMLMLMRLRTRLLKRLLKRTC